MKPILEINNVSKKFRINHDSQPYLSLRESISSAFRYKKATSEEFYALNNVSFSVNPGESIGIIGKNGAGKSTLLKILSKITPPTTGNIIVRGRIASLLEVGTGFHPELTGRENIFLNGSILGMKRREIQSKFDEIVDFSGTEKFLDTPLKHFSSGMQLRLAFSVAAFLEPEILVIDEVLAVGDMEFQKKCIGKMEQVGREGRTILFVSHNLGALANLCQKGLVINSGNVVFTGESNEAVQYYHSRVVSAHDSFGLMDRKDRAGTGKVRFSSVRFLNKNNDEVMFFKSGDDIKIEVMLQADDIHYENKVFVALVVKDSMGDRLTRLSSAYYNKEINIANGSKIIWKWEHCQLIPGEYRCDLNMYEGYTGVTIVDRIQDAFGLTIMEGDYFGNGVIPQVRFDKMFSDFEITSSI